MQISILTFTLLLGMLWGTASAQALNPSPYEDDYIEVSFPDGWDLYKNYVGASSRGYTLSNLEEDAYLSIYYFDTGEDVEFNKNVGIYAISFGYFLRFGDRFKFNYEDSLKLDVEGNDFAPRSERMVGVSTQSDISETLDEADYHQFTVEYDNGEYELNYLMLLDPDEYGELRSEASAAIVLSCPLNEIDKYKAIFEEIMSKFKYKAG